MDLTRRTISATASKEIKASSHYQYVLNGITLDGSKFTAGELLEEGLCLVMDNATKKYEKYEDHVDTGVHSFPTDKSNPMILDESIKFEVKDDGTNPDVTAGQVLVHASVHEGMLTGCTASFKAALAGAIRFV